MTAPVGLREQMEVALRRSSGTGGCAHRERLHGDTYAYACPECQADAVLSVLAGQVDVLADVLAEHRPYLDITLQGADDLTCYNPATLKFCGWQHVSDDGAECAREHAKHQAAVLVSRMVGGER